MLSGPEALWPAALEVAEDARFSPATEDGVPVAVELPWVLQFAPAPPVTPTGTLTETPTETPTEAPPAPEPLRAILGERWAALAATRRPCV